MIRLLVLVLLAGAVTGALVAVLLDPGAAERLLAAGEAEGPAAAAERRFVLGLSVGMLLVLVALDGLRRVLRRWSRRAGRWRAAP